MKKVAQTALRLLLGTLFLYAAIKKGFSQEEFGLVVAKVLEPIELTEWAREGIVWAVVLAEAILGALLLVDITVKRASEAIMLTMAVFTIALAILMLKNEPCGCFGSRSELVTGFDFARNFLITASAWLLRKFFEQPTKHSNEERDCKNENPAFHRSIGVCRRNEDGKCAKPCANPQWCGTNEHRWWIARSM